MNKRKKTLRWFLLLILVAAITYALFRLKQDHDQEIAVEAAQQEEHYVELNTEFYDLEARGFVQITSSILPPTRAGNRTRNETWVRLPENTLITTTQLDGRPTLQMPPGAVVERLTWLREEEEDGAWTLADVRGISHLERGAQRFHVYRPKTTEIRSELFGFEWKRGDTEASASALEHFKTMLGTGMGFALEEPRFFKDKMIHFFSNMHACEGCHTLDRPQQNHIIGRTPSQATDRAGLFVFLGVLQRSAPTRVIEKAAPHDPNTENPFITVRCEGKNAEKKEERGRMRRPSSFFYACPENAKGEIPVPIATLDLRAAMTAEHPHAKAVCASRHYVFEHLDDEGRKRFSEAFSACGIAETP